MSIHCVDCKHYDSNRPETCCSNSIQPKTPTPSHNPDHKDNEPVKIAGMAMLLGRSEIEHIGC